MERAADPAGEESLAVAPAEVGEGLEVMTDQECRRLLAEGGVGRISVVTGGAPAIRPVNFALDDERLVVRTGDGVIAAAARDGATAEFEIDQTRTRDHEGWSVIVTGTLSELTAAEGRNLPLLPWAPGERGHLVAVSLDRVGGRRLGSAPVGAPPAVGDAEVDYWGRSEASRQRARRLLGPIYRRWFRFEWEGLERIPPVGGALLVANHGGAVPIDAALVMHGIESELGRPVYGLHHYGLRAVPYVGTALARNGGVNANPDNALRLLRDDQQLVLVFPEGTKGTTKPFTRRYRLARFGRGGYVEAAMRAGVPIVPIALVGTDDTMPTVARVPTGRETGIPVTLNWLLFGPLGAVLHFPVKIRARVLEPITFNQPPGLEVYPASDVAAAADLIRSRVQAEVTELVRRRRGVWSG